MEDAELDDFFAKKDKSKRKAKAAKFTASDILAKQSEKPKKTAKKKKEKEKSNQPGSTKTVKKEEDDEWVDYEEEAEKDFSDLKIQKLQIGKDDDGERLGEGTNSETEGGEGYEKKDGPSGPWNKTSTTSNTPETTETAPPVEKEQPPAKEPPKPTGKYIPPAVRRAMDGGGVVSSVGIRRKKQAPNVMSEEDFPSLGGTHPESSADGVSTVAPPGRFEQVRGGSRQVDDAQGQSQCLEIGNKFDALSSADS